MIAAPATLGSFVVNVGHLAKIPFGEARVFKVGSESIAVVRSMDGSVLAIEPNCPSAHSIEMNAEQMLCPVHGMNFERCVFVPDGPYRETRRYPAMVNDAGEILVGIEQILKRR